MNIVREAASNLKGHWLQGKMRDGDNRCGIGWLCETAKQTKLNDQVLLGLSFMTEVVREQYPERLDGPEISSIPPFAKFNDHPHTTEDDVVAVMEKAAVRLDEEL